MSREGKSRRGKTKGHVSHGNWQHFTGKTRSDRTLPRHKSAEREDREKNRKKRLKRKDNIRRTRGW